MGATVPLFLVIMNFTGRFYFSCQVAYAAKAFGLSVTLLFLVSCGGGGRSEAPAVDTVAPTAAITFPPSNAFTNAATLTVTGTADDSSTITAVLVNGVNAATTDGFSTWRAVVSLAAGLNTLSVETTDSALNRDTNAAQASLIQGPVLSSVGSGALFGDPARVAIDEVNNRALVTDSGGLVRIASTLIAADFTTGNRAIISGSAQGIGPSFGFPNGIALDAANNRALVIDSFFDALFGVDLNTGNRNILSDVSTSGGIGFVDPRVPVLDAANNRVFVTDPGLPAVLAVDLLSGFRTVVSGNATGSGPLFTMPDGIALDTSNNRLLVTDGVRGAVFAVNIGTGDRTIVSDAATGSGTNFVEPADIVIDPATSIALITDTFLDAVITVDLTTGNRIILSGMNAGSGINFSFPLGMAVTDTPERLIVIDSSTDALYQVEPGSGDRVVISK